MAATPSQRAQRGSRPGGTPRRRRLQGPLPRTRSRALSPRAGRRSRDPPGADAYVQTQPLRTERASWPRVVGSSTFPRSPGGPRAELGIVGASMSWWVQFLSKWPCGERSSTGCEAPGDPNERLAHGVKRPHQLSRSPALHPLRRLVREPPTLHWRDQWTPKTREAGPSSLLRADRGTSPWPLSCPYTLNMMLWGSYKSGIITPIGASWFSSSTQLPPVPTLSFRENWGQYKETTPHQRGFSVPWKDVEQTRHPGMVLLDPPCQETVTQGRGNVQIR